MSDLSKHVKALRKLTSEGAETGAIASAVERVLGLDPNHFFALQCKVVCCLHRDKYGSAMEVLEQMEEVHRKEVLASADFHFQKAYCYYRMSRYTEAQEELRKSRGSAAGHVPSRNLQAQIHYHFEQYAEAAKEYESLLAQSAYRDEQEKTELLTNYTAVLAMAKNAKKAMQVVRDADEKTGDLVYNSATAQVEAGEDPQAALKTLQQAEALIHREHHSKSSLRTIADVLALPAEARAPKIGGGSAFERPDTPERRFFNEVSLVWVQMAYVHFVLQQLDQAAAILNVVLQAKPTSAVTIAIAAVNWTAAQRHTDFFDALRKLKAAQNPKVVSRLQSRQLLAVHYNMALLHLHAGSVGSCRKEVDQMEKAYPNSPLTHTLRLALTVRENRNRQSDSAAIRSYLKRYEQVAGGKSTATVQLIAAQIFLESNDLAAAVSALTAADIDAALRYKPATVTTLAAWTAQSGDVDGALELVREAVLRPGTSAAAKRAVLAWAVDYFTQRHRHAEVTACLKAVRAAAPALAADKVVTALLALSLSYHNLPEARACMKLVDGAAVAPGKLATSAVAQLERQLPSKTALEELGYRRPTIQEEARRQLQRRRARPMRRPPKSTEGKIDPERWVPMSVRSYIKDLPERRKKELRRLRAIEQEQKRRQQASRAKEGDKASA
ncbi:signal recognition particle subunit SRP72 [Strigomonas culicis]|uniref:Signal recognition particle subunit SRP72 n=1 Tax=Strigomonas culicis TaxID=28005 RepID=S9VHR0_9TRYP|nr:signal recognition particle subunit SRP72 [Strigomonas culicis]|eukprot:EPY22730.1 signal recognition particle subunit SRP72 [Strigomonas culicis]